MCGLYVQYINCMIEKNLKHNTVKESFPILGMSCASCAARVNKVLNDRMGVYEASVNYATGTAQVTFNPQACSVEDLQKTVRDAGYDLVLPTPDEEETIARAHADKYRKLKKETIGAILLAILILTISMFLLDIPFMKYIVCILSTIVVFGFGKTFYVNAWKQLKHGTSNMDTLVANSTGIAYLFSVFNLLFPDFWLSRGMEANVYFDASSGIIAFILLGRMLEERAKQRTSSSIRKLMGLQPKTVTVVTDNGERVIPVKEARKGDTIAVKPGERIALDGIVVGGKSYVDESMLSGEPIPSLKEKDAKVYAGTVNQRGSLLYQVVKTGSDTVLAQIIRMVQEAQGSKMPVQKLVDKVASIFVPTIILLAVSSFIAWILLAQDDGFSHGLLALVTVLIIACPCALGLATPTAIIVGIGKGAEYGILIKDATALEIARKVDAVVLDKTGTITEGHPALVREDWKEDSEEWKDILYSLERLSEHPLAEAVVNGLKERRSVPISDFVNIPGKGVKGCYNHQTYYVGNLSLIKEHSIRMDGTQQDKAREWEEDGSTIVWFANEQRAIGLLALTDEIRKTSAAAVSSLQKMGIEVYMLTGDNAVSANKVARKASIKHIKSEIFPKEKALFIRQLQEKGHTVAMIGDGINDSAALAQANLSIAMGKGCDITIDTAMVTILSSDLQKIAETIRLSHMTIRTIRENLFWAFIYNLIGIPIAAGVFYPINGFLLNPMIAGAAMAFSSVSVVTNSLRLKRKKLNRTISLPPSEEKNPTNKEIDKPTYTVSMKKEYKVDGMMCNHCRTHVENALNSIEGVKAVVTLDPPMAIIEFADKEPNIGELQKAITEKAGDYTITAI